LVVSLRSALTPSFVSSALLCVSSCRWQDECKFWKPQKEKKETKVKHGKDGGDEYSYALRSSSFVVPLRSRVWVTEQSGFEDVLKGIRGHGPRLARARRRRRWARRRREAMMMARGGKRAKSQGKKIRKTAAAQQAREVVRWCRKHTKRKEE